MIHRLPVTALIKVTGGPYGRKGTRGSNMLGHSRLPVYRRKILERECIGFSISKGMYLE